jgi:hypothetical protein
MRLKKNTVYGSNGQPAKARRLALVGRRFRGGFSSTSSFRRPFLSDIELTGLGWMVIGKFSPDGLGGVVAGGRWC